MFNATSSKRLSMVNQSLAKVMLDAQIESIVIFQISEGLRDISRQKTLVETGASLTMNSKHLTGDAVDIAVFNSDNSYCTELKEYIKVAQCIQIAAKRNKTSITWGALWDTPLNLIDHPVTIDDVEAYRKRQRELNIRIGKPDKKILIDGPHFERTTGT